MKKPFEQPDDQPGGLQRIDQVLPKAIVRYQGIPTEYKGIVFRSRLEARWASFFDLCGWDWVYEPFDCQGWIPDFQIGQTLVEIKPNSKFQEFEDAISKAESAMVHEKRELLLLGIAPRGIEQSAVLDEGGMFRECKCYLGWLGELSAFGWDYDRCRFGRWPDEKFGFCHASGNWTCRVSGKHFGGDLPMLERKELDAMWAIASNATKWRPSK